MSGTAVAPGGMDESELRLFRDAIERATASLSGERLDEALEDIGWADAAAADGRAAVAVLFERLGAVAGSSAALGQVILGALGLPPVEDTAVLVPALGRSTATGGRGGGDVPAPVLGLAELRRRGHALVVEDDGDRTRAARVPVSELALRPVHGIDPDAELVEVTFAGPVEGWDWEVAPRPWEDAVAASRRALAHEQLGAMRTMLRLAREHALHRVQFGQPVARFQAVRHRLAEALVAVEAAEAAIDGAWLDGSPFTATVAKAVAGTSARTVRRHAQQVLAGIGFTTEHDLHRFVRRSIVLDGLFGDAASLTDEIGEALLRAGHLPDLLPL